MAAFRKIRKPGKDEYPGYSHQANKIRCRSLLKWVKALISNNRIMALFAIEISSINFFYEWFFKNSD